MNYSCKEKLKISFGKIYEVEPKGRERKMKFMNKNLAIFLVILCVILTAGLVGAIINYTSIIKERDEIINEKDETIASLNTQIRDLNETYQTLLESYNKLKEKYQLLRKTVLTFDGLNITDLAISSGWLRTVMGNVTNISNESMPKVYVVLFVYNPDGTLDSYHVETIENLYINETNPFEFPNVLTENQWFRILAVGNDGLCDIKTSP